MGLFGKKKKDDGVIDLGDGQVALSPERSGEMADHTVQKILETYEDPIPAGSFEAIEEAIRQRQGPGLTDELEGLLVSLARMGYGSRQFEDEVLVDTAAVPWLTAEIEGRLAVAVDEGRDLIYAFAEIAAELCDYDRDDPSAPRSTDAIDAPMVPLRDLICEKIVVASSNLAASNGMSEPGGLPEGMDGAGMFAVWRIGFLVRALEKSLPPNWTDPDVTLIVVDSEAAREAAYRWSEEHPDCTQEESDEAMRRVMLDPQFRIDVDDERVGVDPRFIMFELDANGEIIPQP